MLSYSGSGEGKPLVLLHAYPLMSKMWGFQIPFLSEKFQVIVPDLPGFGKSPIQPGIQIADMALEVAHLLDHLNITQPVFVAGLSMGGYAAFEFFRQFPKRVSGLGLFATRATADLPEARENRFKSIEAMERFGLEPFAKKAVKSQLGKTSQEKNPDLIQSVLEVVKENQVEGAVEAQKAMAARRDSSDLLESIKVPVLILAGQEDILSTPQEMRGMHEKIKGSEFHVILESGHLINLEQPELFNAALQDFLKRHFAV